MILVHSTRILEQFLKNHVTLKTGITFLKKLTVILNSNIS